MWSALAILVMAVMVPVVLYRTSAVLIGTVRNVIVASPRFAITAFASGSASAIFGYLKNGDVTIEIVVYGFLGCLLYVIALLVKFDGK
jgi:hypothetical protein